MYWTYVTVPLYASSALMHSIGFFLLYKVEFRPENQRLILMHLSAAEFFQSVITAVEHTLYVLVKEIERVLRYSIWTNFSIGILLKFILIHLIVDRTFEIPNNCHQKKCYYCYWYDSFVVRDILHT